MPEVFQKGTLYLCPTPIGNLEDITYRTVRCLREADLIAAEDTRHTKQLLMAYDIDTPLTSYHEHNKAEKGPQLIEKLKDGLMIALVSDAGMPAICDPGSDMVRLALEADIPIVPLPGANAGLTGLIASGMDTTRFTFVGFLPKTQKHLHGHLSDLQAALSEQGTRGEFVILVEGMTKMAEEANPENVDYAALVQELMEQGIAKKEAVRTVARRCGVPKRSVYQAALSL